MILFRTLILFICLNFADFIAAQSVNNKIILLENDFYRITISQDLSFELESFDFGQKGKILAYSNSLSKIIIGDKAKTAEFFIAENSVTKEETIYGSSSVIQLVCNESGNNLLYSIKIIVPDVFNNLIIIYPSFRNLSDGIVDVSKFIACDLNTNRNNLGVNNISDIWTFQPESTPERQNWVKPLTDNFYQKNFQGMNAPDYGGGIPLLDLWTKNQGIALASLSTKPEFILFPVNVTSNDVNFRLENSSDIILKPKEDYFAQPFAIILHKGDFFNALRTYSELLQKEGVNFPRASDNALETEWCAWGYERNFNVNQILKSLDDVDSLGIKWITIDDGWQSADGDWQVSNEKFIDGEKGLVKLIEYIHSRGLKVRLWWVPLTAHDSAYNSVHFPERMNEFGMKTQSKIAQEHSDWFILDENGERYQVSWWNSYQFCPALKEVREYYRAFVKKAILEWGVDGFKIDGQNINLAPPCYNPSHHHYSPFESSEATPLFFQNIYETAKSIKPDFLIQICPCGTNYSVYNLPFVDQVVASDPLNSEQVRIKGKTFKALFGNNIAYSGDHVELTNRKWDENQNKFVVYKDEDFASTIGVGGVPSTKFTNPSVPQSDSSLMLSAEKKNIWRKWLKLYDEIRLSEGEYLNLYDIAFDKPETHLIRRDDILYYSLFAQNFDGFFEFRGLESDKNYEIKDVVRDEVLGIINKTNPSLKLKFSEYLILQGRPIL
ncbi:glycoside hydrolase family 36 protein [Ignavibacterium album]|uniref:glycoside hydrolase family 36 protein n=1 Tax=Ignavibacterium album TaxID=591197 RepID=UPI0035B97871